MIKLAKLASILVFVLILLSLASIAGAQTAIPAPAAPAQPQTLENMVAQAIFAVISTFLLFVVNYCKNYIQQLIKTKSHERGHNVVKDALYSALDETGLTLKAVLSDKAVKDAVKPVWLKISLVRLENLSGFKKKDPETWVTEQMSIILGKLNQ